MNKVSAHCFIEVVDERNPDFLLSSRWACLQAYELTDAEREELAICARIARARASRVRKEFTVTKSFNV